MQKLDVQIEGMGCGRCVNKVADALNGVPGVRVETVEVGRATIACDSPTTGQHAVVEALAKAGYAARFVQASA